MDNLRDIFAQERAHVNDLRKSSDVNYIERIHYSCIYATMGGLLKIMDAPKRISAAIQMQRNKHR